MQQRTMLGRRHFPTHITIDFIRENEDRIDFQKISKERTLPIDVVREYKDRLDWRYATYNLFVRLGEERERLVDEFADYVDWDIISGQGEWGLDFIRTNKDKLNWELVTERYKFDSDFLDEMDEYIDWQKASWHQVLTSEQIRKHANELDWNSISERQLLSYADLKEFGDRIDWDAYFSSSYRLNSGSIFRYRFYEHWIGDLKDVIDFGALSEHFNISLDTAKDYKDYLDADRLMKNRSLGEDQSRLKLILGELPSKVDFEKLARKSNGELSHAATMLVREYFIDNPHDAEWWKGFSLDPSTTEDALMRFGYQIDWAYLSDHRKMSEDLIMRAAGRLDWDKVLKFQDLSSDFRHRFVNSSDFQSIHRAPMWAPDEVMLTPSFMRTFKDNLNWTAISKEKWLTDELIREFADRLNWDKLLYNGVVSSNLIVDNTHRIRCVSSWDSVSEIPGLPEDFIEKNIDSLSWWRLAKHQKMSTEFILRHIDQMYVEDQIDLFSNPNITDETLAAIATSINWVDVSDMRMCMRDDELPPRAIPFLEKYGYTKQDFEKFNNMSIDEIVERQNELNWDKLSACRQFSNDELRLLQDHINWRIYLKKWGDEMEFRTLLEFHDHVQGNVDWKEYSVARHGDLPKDCGQITSKTEPWSEQDEPLKDAPSKEFWEEISRSYVIIPSFAETFKDQLIPECLLENQSLKHKSNEASWSAILTRPMSEDVLHKLTFGWPKPYPVNHDDVCRYQKMSAKFIKANIDKWSWCNIVFNREIELSEAMKVLVDLDKSQWNSLKYKISHDDFNLLRAAVETFRLTGLEQVVDDPRGMIENHKYMVI